MDGPSCGGLAETNSLKAGLFDEFLQPLMSTGGGDPSQPFADVLIGVMFIIFLMMFVLIGIYPAVKRTVDRIRAYLRERGTWEEFERNSTARSGSSKLTVRQADLQLSEYEELVLRSLAMSRSRVRRSKTIADELIIAQAIVDEALAALNRKHLIRSFEIHLCGHLYFLTETGREYAAAHGLSPFPSRRI